MQRGKCCPQLNHPSTPGCPCQWGALQCHGDSDREESKEDPSVWDGMIPALMSDVPGCSSTPASCGRYLFMSVQSPVFFLGPSTFLCTQMTCPCLAGSEHCPKTWQASPKTWAAHLTVVFFPGCLKTWMLPMGQESFMLPCEAGTRKQAEANAASRRG